MDSELEKRKLLSFEQAEGAAPLPEQLKLKEVSPHLRAHLWAFVRGKIHESTYSPDYGSRLVGDPFLLILFDMHVLRYGRMADEFSNRYDGIEQQLKSIFEKGDYLAVFGWLQWVMRHHKTPYLFSQSIGSILQKHGAAYRVLDDTTIVPIASESEFQALKQSITAAEKAGFSGAKSHLQEAADCLSTGEYTDSIRESIHAVESAARVLEPSADLSKALTRLEDAGKIHGALKRGFLAIYGYTSDEKGIRHPLLNDAEAKVDETDAIFMIGACASFVSYLINKARSQNLV
jgi:hypothetical protein